MIDRRPTRCEKGDSDRKIKGWCLKTSSLVVWNAGALPASMSAGRCTMVVLDAQSSGPVDPTMSHLENLEPPKMVDRESRPNDCKKNHG